MRKLLLAGGLFGLFLAWNMPNHYPPWTAFHGELAAALAACLLFAGVAWPQQLGRVAAYTAGTAQGMLVRLALPAAAWVWLVAAMAPALQYLAGRLVFRGDAALGLLYGLGTALSIYTSFLWSAQAGHERVLRWLWATVVAGALAAFGLAMAQWLRLGPWGWWAMELIDVRPFANFGQPNHFGLLMVWGIVAATALYEMRVLQHRASYGLAVLALAWGVLLSQSRASILALLAIAACWAFTRRGAATRLRAFEVALALAVAALLYFSFGSIEDALYLSAADLRSPLEVGPREAIWRHFWAAILEHPGLGYGFGQGVLALSEVATQVAPSRNTIYAHNVVLDLMTWFGMPLGLAMMAALVGWMLGWLRPCADASLAAQRRTVFAVWLALTVQSLLEFPYAHAYFLLPAALLAGAVGSPPPPSGLRPGQSFAASRWVMALAALAAALLVTLAWEYLQMEDDVRANRFERYNFTHRPEHVPFTRPLMLDQLAALNASAHIVLRPGMPPEEIEALHVVARRFHLLPTRLDYAKALALNGRLAEAEGELRIIRGIYHPLLYARIERDWRDWLQEHRGEIAGP